MADAARSQDIQAVVRATEVLRLVSERGSVGVRDVTSQIGLDRTTAHRYLSTLVGVGFLARIADGPDAGNYRFGSFAAIVGAAAGGGKGPIHAATESLQSIADHSRATALVSTVSGSSVVVAEVRYPATERLSVRIPLGYRVPRTGVQTLVALAHASAALRRSALASAGSDRGWMAAALERAHADGGLSEITSEGVAVIAVPLRQNGSVVATLAVLALPRGPEWADETFPYLVERASAFSQV